MIAPEKIWANPYYGMLPNRFSGIWKTENPFDRGTEYTRTDLSQAAVAAALEAAAAKLQNVADNWDCGHNESRLCDCAPYVEQWGLAADEIRALITPDQHGALAAHGAAAVANARAEDAALRDAARPLLNMAMWTESAEDTEVVIVTVGTVRAIRNALAQIGAKP